MSDDGLPARRPCYICLSAAGGDSGGAPCHRCPDAGGILIPGCMGSAVYARSDRDLSHCTCERRRLALLPLTGTELLAVLQAVEAARGAALTPVDRNLVELATHVVMDVMRHRRPGTKGRRV